ncbi:transposase [Streptomyces atratus]|uniref:transposase n=1 Tax=Streptomyces atratus TaxID=1893 RepID=UPI003F69621E
MGRGGFTPSREVRWAEGHARIARTGGHPSPARDRLQKVIFRSEFGFSRQTTGRPLSMLGVSPTRWASNMRTGPLDAVRLEPADDPAEVTASQIRDLVARLERAGQWRPGDLPVLFVLDSGYDIVRLTWLLREEPVRLLGRIRADRVMRAPAGMRRGTRPGRPPRHGAEFRLADPAAHPAPAQESAGVHDRFGQVLARCWGRLHPKLDARLMGPPRRRTPHHGRRVGPSGGRAPARQPRPQAAMAVAQRPRRHRARHRPPLADLPSTIRYRTHFPLSSRRRPA